MTFPSCSFIVQTLGDAEAKFASVERINYYSTQLSQEGTTTANAPPPPADWPTKGTVVFSDVVMRYRASLAPALRGVTFTVSPGVTVGVVGRTGAGKSSLAAALFRLVELESGSVSVDGVNLAHVPLSAIRGHAVCIITQEPVLFSGPLRNSLGANDVLYVRA